MNIYERYCSRVLEHLLKNKSSVYSYRDYGYLLVVLKKYGYISSSLFYKQFCHVDKFIKNSVSTMNSVGLWYGLPSVDILYREADKIGIIYPNTKKEIFEKICVILEYLLGTLKKDYTILKNNHTYIDLFSGLTGIIRYLYYIDNIQLAEEYLHILCEIVIHDEFEKGDTSFFYDTLYAYKNNIHQNNAINMSISHGLCGILSVLKTSLKVDKNTSKKILAIKKLENLYLKYFNWNTFSFRKFVSKDMDGYCASQFDYRWCYGDIAIFINLLRNMPNNAIFAKSEKIFEYITEYLTKLELSNYCFCHGMAGLQYNITLLRDLIFKKDDDNICGTEYITNIRYIMLERINELFEGDHEIVNISLIDGEISEIVSTLILNKEPDFKDCFFSNLFLVG